MRRRQQPPEIWSRGSRIRRPVTGTTARITPEGGIDFMLIYVLNHHGKPLMPCSPAKARHLLESGKAKVVRRDPFTIKLLFGSSGYAQEVVAGMDAGSKTIGAAATANGKVVYQAEVSLRDDGSGEVKQRAMYRRNPSRAGRSSWRPSISTRSRIPTSTAPAIRMASGRDPTTSRRTSCTATVTGAGVGRKASTAPDSTS